MSAAKKVRVAAEERIFLFSSESVNEGHPDKVADQVSDAVLDACLAADPYSKVACETATKDNMVMVFGEITTGAKLDYNAIDRPSAACSDAKRTLAMLHMPWHHNHERPSTWIKRIGGLVLWQWSGLGMIGQLKRPCLD